ncbi:MAG: thioesterase family protein [Deferrisomatales bacterium]|nr:thioesterase family protein [Deferrisomatales bacterium]
MITLGYRVQWSDVDYARIVYFLRYPEWVADGFHRVLYERGFSLRESVAAGYGLPYVDTSCRYHRALTLEDEAEIRMNVTDLDAKGFTLHYEIFQAGEPNLVADGTMVRRCISLQPRRSQPMPETLYRILGEIAGDSDHQAAPLNPRGARC